jgi:hypothetical protein
VVASRILGPDSQPYELNGAGTNGTGNGYDRALFGQITGLQDPRGARIRASDESMDRFMERTQVPWDKTGPVPFANAWEMRHDPAVSLGLAIVTEPLKSLTFETEGESLAQRRLAYEVVRRLWCALSMAHEAIYFGFWPAEIVWAFGELKSEKRVDAEGFGRSMTFRDALYPAELRDLVPDKELTRPLQTKGGRYLGLENRTATDPQTGTDQDWKFVPPARTLWYVPDRRFGSLFGGVTRARVVFRDWYLKRVERHNWGKYLGRRGEPTPYGWAPNTAEKDPRTGQLKNALLMMEQALIRLNNGYPLVVPYVPDYDTGKNKYGVELLQDDKRGDQFLQAISYCDLSIVRGIVGPEKTGIQGTRQGTYAETSAHQNLFWDMLQGHVESFQYWINTQLIPLVLRFNFPRPDPTVRLRIESVRATDRDLVNKVIEKVFESRIKIGDREIACVDAVDKLEFLRQHHFPIDLNIFENPDLLPEPAPDEGAPPKERAA